MEHRVSRPGFTLIQLFVVLVVLVIVMAIAMIVATPGSPTNRTANSLLRDQTQVRGILQGMVVWAQNSGDRYPLPSVIDTNNTTVAAEGAAKDTTANIFSLLVYNGFVPVEMFVSAAETNPNIKVYSAYQTDRPAAAANPGKALWDPAFSADFTSPKGGNVSYAHAIPAGARPGAWSNTFTATDAVLGNRGPEVASVTKNEDRTVTPVLANPKSNTLLIHGPPTTWEGQIGFSDNHVDFAMHAWGEGVTYRASDGKTWPDLYFYDEPDDPDHVNTLLGIFLTAGPERKDFKSIWD